MHLNGELTGYKVWLRDSANRKDQIMDGLPTSQIIFNLDPSLKYHLEVVAYNVDRGNELRSEVVQLKFTTRPGKIDLFTASQPSQRADLDIERLS